MLAFTFPGQGSQRPGVGRPWVDHDSWELVAEASEIAGRDIGTLLLDADGDELRDTRNAQLTTFVSSLLVLDAVQRLGIDACWCAGHSLGEYTALAATGALGFEEGVELVQQRAAAMHDAAARQPGTMSAVLGLDDEQVEVACDLADDDVWVANFNAPGQVVIAGSPRGVDAAGRHAKDLGARRVMELPVSGAFHTSFMASARDRLLDALDVCDIRDADAPVVSNVDALPHTCGHEWASLLSAQLASPVLWKQGLLTLAEAGVTAFVELGPGGVLSGMAKRTVTGSRTISVSTPADLDKLLVWLDGDDSNATPGGDDRSFASERLVVAPAAGAFTPLDVRAGDTIAIGDVIGLVGDVEVRSPFAGSLQSFVALDTERVTARQPIARLRSS